MAHGDDDGAVLPPRVAPAHVVMLPVTPKPETRAAVLAAVEKLAAELRAQTFAGEPLRVEIDARDLGGGTKKLGVDQEGRTRCAWRSARAIWRKGTVAVARRDRTPKEKEFPTAAEFVSRAPGDPAGNPGRPARPRHRVPRRAHRPHRFEGRVLRLLHAARRPISPRSTAASRSPTGTASREVEEQIKEDLKVTIRCIPRGMEDEPGRCIITGEPSKQRVIFAKSY